jgi:hypothetical protein
VLIFLTNLCPSPFFDSTDHALGAYLVSKSANDALLNHFGYTCYDGLRPDNKADAIQLLKQNLPPDEAALVIASM